MYQILITCREACTAAVALVPIFWFINKYSIQNTRKSLFYLIFSIYLAAMYSAVGLPDVTYFRFKANINFVPFLYMFSAWETTFLNVLLFFPLGLIMPMLWKHYQSLFRTVLLGFGMSFTIELLQLFTYRASDINDLMTNTLGTMIGYLASRVFVRLFPVISPSEDTKEIPLVFGVVFLTMFFVYPYLTRFI